MSDVAEKIARAVLYEGHMLYPYRRSALKNRRPWSFGTLAPESWAAPGVDPSRFRAECLAKVTANARVSVSLRFLHLSQLLTPIAKMPPGSMAYGEAVERMVAVPDLPVATLAASPSHVRFNFAASLAPERGCRWRPVSGELQICAENAGEGLVKIAIQASNNTPITPESTRDDALLTSLVAAHAALEISEGEFISLLDPPEEFVAATTTCRNEGVYPVLVGAAGERREMIASPVILYDYPEVAPESLGDFFDATEMDEMLALRVLTLTDDEKREMLNSGEQARAILARTESMPPEQLLKVHGVLRGLRKVEEP